MTARSQEAIEVSRGAGRPSLLLYLTGSWGGGVLHGESRTAVDILPLLQPLLQRNCRIDCGSPRSVICQLQRHLINVWSASTGWRVHGFHFCRQPSRLHRLATVNSWADRCASVRGWDDEAVTEEYISSQSIRPSCFFSPPQGFFIPVWLGSAITTQQQ